MEDTR
jgi:hypothetical protein